MDLNSNELFISQLEVVPEFYYRKIGFNCYPEGTFEILVTYVLVVEKLVMNLNVGCCNQTFIGFDYCGPTTLMREH